jgi:hypothetical protein
LFDIHGIPALAAIEEVGEAVDFGVGQGFGCWMKGLKNETCRGFRAPLTRE